MKKRSAASWSVSIIIHSVLAIAIARYSYKLAFPEGAVETVTIETFGDKNAPVQPPAPPVAQETKEEVPVEKATAPKAVKVAKAAKVAPPVFLPDKPANDIQPEDKMETQEESPVVVPEPIPEAKQEEEKTPAPEAVPVPAPEQSSDNLAKQEVAAPEATAEPAQGPPTTQEPRPQFGTPGSIIDETKLTERPGNRKPSYPWMARLRRQQGTTVIKAFVRKDGFVDSLSLYQSSGSPLLDKESMDSYSKWKYAPGSSGWVLKPFKFSLVDSK